MKTKVITAVLSLFLVNAFAQDRTTVSATNSEISDNLDLRAVASLFGDSRDLEDFENRLNDPKNQISNLDLNGDNQVDYIRVIESVEGRTHIIVLQSVLGKDLFQDIASVEVEKDSNNRVQVQVVGDVYMYGSNYIYEPVYVSTPIIYSHFWVPNYRPYYSGWYWGYYPSYYYAWTPFPIFRYRSHIGLYINFNHHYNYVNYRRCHVAYNSYYGRRANGYERQYPGRSFASRNAGYTNRYDLDRTRNIRTVGSGNRSEVNPRSGGRTETAANTNLGGPRAINNPRTKGTATSTASTSGPRVTNGGGRSETTTNYGGPKVSTNGGGRSETASASNNYGGPRAVANPRTKTETNATTSGPRVNSTPRSESSVGNPRVTSTPRNQSSGMGSPRAGSSESAPRGGSYGNPRSSSRSETVSAPRNSGGSGMSSAPRGNSGGGNSSRGNSGGNGSRR